MSQTDTLKAAFREPVALSRRERRAEQTRRRALSPVRILVSLLLVPLVTLGLTISIYVRTSPYERQDALRHLAALSGCETAAKLGVPRARQGTPGYHPRNDPDGDGIACNENDVGPMPPYDPTPEAPARHTGGAKFLRP